MEQKVENDYEKIDDIQLSQKFKFEDGEGGFEGDENENEYFEISKSPEEKSKGKFFSKVNKAMSYLQNQEGFAKPIKLLSKGLSFYEGMKDKIINKLGGRLDDVEEEIETLTSSTKLTPFDSKEFNAAFAVVSEGSPDIDPSQIEDVFLALGYTLQDSDLRQLMLDVHTDKDGKVSIESLSHTYTSWRKNTTEYGKKFKLEYEQNVFLLFKLLMKEKRIPSTYRIKNLLSNVKGQDIGSQGLNEEILANILAQGTLDENVFDHEDIHPDDVENVLRELIIYIEQSDSSWTNNLMSKSSAPHPEDADFISSKDFFRFMAFR